MDIIIVLAVLALMVYLIVRDSGEETPAPVREPEPEIDLDQMTKAELLDLAERVDADVKKSWTKAKIIQAIAVKLAEEIASVGGTGL